LNTETKNSFGHRARLRERFVKSGSAAFAEHELLELLLTFAIPRKDTKQIAKQLLLEFGSLHDILNASIDKLSMVDGVGENSAILIRLIREFHKPSINTGTIDRTQILNTEAAANI
jgi:DNA repair protein RadC